MKKLFTLLALGALLVVPALVLANRAVPPPEPPKEKATTIALVIEIDEQAKEPTLRVPRKLAASWKAALGDSAAPNHFAFTSVQTIVVGVALSLSLVCGGLWIVRHRGRSNGKGLVLILASLLSLATGGSLWANIALRPSRDYVAVGCTFDKAKVIVVEEGNSVKLTLSSAYVAKLRQPALAN